CVSILFTSPATSPLFSLSLHDALPISGAGAGRRTTDACAHDVRRAQLLPDEQVGALRPSLRGNFGRGAASRASIGGAVRLFAGPDRKSTRLNSSHSQISYAVFCLKKKT